MKLKRYLTNDNFIRGVLIYKNDILCHTLELPYLDNQKNISSIPDGLYKISKYSGTKFKNSFWVHDVPNRHAILIHVGNSTMDTKGCILVGVDTAPRMVLKSQEAMNILNAILPFETTLRITTC